jgi:hypothetical protein
MKGKLMAEHWRQPRRISFRPIIDIPNLHWHLLGSAAIWALLGGLAWWMS